MTAFGLLIPLAHVEELFSKGPGGQIGSELSNPRWDGSLSASLIERIKFSTSLAWDLSLSAAPGNNAIIEQRIKSNGILLHYTL